MTARIVAAGLTTSAHSGVGREMLAREQAEGKVSARDGPARRPVHNHDVLSMTGGSAD